MRSAVRGLFSFLSSFVMVEFIIGKRNFFVVSAKRFFFGSRGLRSILGFILKKGRFFVRSAVGVLVDIRILLSI